MLRFALFSALVILGNASGTRVPGVDWIGAPLNILKGFDPIGSVVDLNWNGTKTGDGKYELPDKVFFIPDTRCSYSSYQFTAETYEEYQSSVTQKYHISGAFKKFSGSYSSETERVKRSIWRGQHFVLSPRNYFFTSRRKFSKNLRICRFSQC